MRTSIFQNSSKKTYKEEYLQIIKVFSSKCITFQKKDYTYFDFINIHIFHNWKYRGTYLDVYEYLESIGISLKSKKISKESFLNFLEFICNMKYITSKLKHYSDHVEYTIPCKSILVHNIPILLKDLGYQEYPLEDRIILLEKDLEINDILGEIPNDLEECLILYKDSNHNGIKIKRLLLNKIYSMMEKDIEKYKSINSPITTNIKFILTKLGVVGDIDKKYQNLSNYKLKKYYDIAYDMILYLLKTEKILKEKEILKNEL